MKKGKISNKMILGIILVISGLFLISYTNKFVKNMSGDILEAQTLNAASVANNLFNVYLQKAEQSSNNSFVKEFLLNTEAGTKMDEAEGYEKVLSTLNSIVESDPENVINAWICDLKNGHMMDTDCVKTLNDSEISSLPGYAASIINKSIITVPYMNDEQNKMVLSAVSPVSDAYGKVTALSGIDINLSSIQNSLSQIKIGKEGSLILIADGDKVAYSPMPDDIGVSFSQLIVTQNVKEAVANSEMGPIQFSIFGNPQYGYISSVGESPWIVLTGIGEKEYMSAAKTTQDMIFAIFVSGIVIIVLLVYIIGRGIIRPIKKLNDAALQLADGNMNVHVDVKSNDEVGIVSDSLNKTVLRLKEYVLYINELSEVLNQISHGDFKFELKQEYTGDFERIKTALIDFRKNMTETLKELYHSSEQVARGSEQVSGSAQALSKNTTEQASAVQQLSATVNEISDKVNKTAENSQFAQDVTAEAGSEIRDCNERMDHLVHAMDEINISSGEIGKIIKTIEDIAFQTNILALNAAVEAARAGTAGKGFAVVADEVRNLASKSAEASKNTAQLIENSLKSVENGTNLANSTAESLQNVVNTTARVVDIVQKISEASSQQAESLTQVVNGIDQISAVVQTNSATAEQSAATSTELSQQAAGLKNLVGRFEI